MNLEDGMQKNQCWNAIVPILREEISEKNRVCRLKLFVYLLFVFFVKKVIPTGHIETPGNPRAWCSVEKDLTVRLKYTS